MSDTLTLEELYHDYASYRNSSGRQIHIGKASDNGNEYKVAIMFGGVQYEDMSNIYVLKDDGQWWQKGHRRDVQCVDQALEVLQSVYQRWLSDLILHEPKGRPRRGSGRGYS